MTTQTEALKLALEALESLIFNKPFEHRYSDVLTTIKEALAQPDSTANLYEELRKIIDGGSESFTHEDAVQYLKDKLAQPEQEPITKLFGTLPIYDEHEFRKGFIAGQRDAFNRLEEQPEQEPVAWFWKQVYTDGYEWKHMADNQADADKFLPHQVIPLYTTPPQRQPLTDEQIAEMWQQYNPLHGIASFARAIESAHGIKE